MSPKLIENLLEQLSKLPGVGRRSLKQLAEHLLSHDAVHVAQVRALKTAAGSPAGR